MNNKIVNPPQLQNIKGSNSQAQVNNKGVNPSHQQTPKTEDVKLSPPESKTALIGSSCKFTSFY